MEQYRDFFLLRGLPDTQREEIISRFSAPAGFSAGETIYCTGHFKTAVGYIIKGKALAVTDNESPLIMKRFEPGMCFGAAAVFGEGDRYVSNIIAESECIIQFVSEELLREAFSRYPETAINYITFLSERVRFLNQKLDVISCQSAEDTVLRYLRSHADGQGIVILPVSMTMLAGMLSLGRASLYRSLDALEKQGLITREKNQIRMNLS